MLYTRRAGPLPSVSHTESTYPLPLETTQFPVQGGVVDVPEAHIVELLQD